MTHISIKFKVKEILELATLLSNELEELYSKQTQIEIEEINANTNRKQIWEKLPSYSNEHIYKNSEVVVIKDRIKTIESILTNIETETIKGFTPQ